jgi:psp operon transcriptional activator
MHHGDALGHSEIFLDFQERLSRVAPVERPVLLIGERGTGKELAAHRLHYLSERWDGPFITLNCSTLAPALIEAELFGHEKGAFTGAEKRRIGRFEAAHGGTLFLDEIGTIPLTVQEKILRVVEYGSFERVGSSQLSEVDVRIVGATNANLPDMARRGEFKPDLLDRLCFEVLFVPPLRHRGEDIVLLASHFAARMALELGRDDVTFSSSALRAFKSYPWPGNVRELKNVVERAVYSAEESVVDEIIFDPFISPYEPARISGEGDGGSSRTGQLLETVAETRGFKEKIKAYELELLTRALNQSRHNGKKAARLLQLSYDQFRGLLKKYRHEIETLIEDGTM